MKLKKKGKNKFFVLLRKYWAVGLGLLYLVFPIDIIPDVIPVFGWGDDALVLIVSLIVNYKKLLKNAGASNPKSIDNLFKAVIKGKSIYEVMENARENGINDKKDEVIEGEIINE